MTGRWCLGVVGLLMILPTLSACSVRPQTTGPFEPTKKSLTVLLTFPRHSARLSAFDLAQLQKSLPSGITHWRGALISAPDESLARAGAVSRVIGITVRAYVPRPADHLAAGVAKLIITRSFTRIASCSGPPVHIQNELWPMTSASGLSLMPAGCTVDRDLDAMLKRSDDAFHGRKLEPTAVQPFIEAARRYETRNLTKPPYGQNFSNDPSQLNAVSASLNGAPSSSAAVSPTGGSTSAVAVPPANASQIP